METQPVMWIKSYGLIQPDGEITVLLLLLQEFLFQVFVPHAVIHIYLQIICASFISLLFDYCN